jgi:transmembrane sensor
MEKYHKFGIEDFIDDNEFRAWVVSPSKDSNARWNKFISGYPQKKELIEQAATIVRSLLPVEDKISKDRLDVIWKRVLKSRNSTRWLHSLAKVSRYAAVFVLAFLLGIGTYIIFEGSDTKYSENYTEINVPYGERSQLTLYDGTKVWLNSGTTLKFPLIFNSDKRKVFVKGEAFFDVAKDRKKPFVVNAGSLNIEVLGTRFNVCAYPDDSEAYATLEEGEIVASTSAGGKVQLKPGEQAVFHSDSKKITLHKVNTELYTSWTENRLKLENAAFSDVIKKMERWYDVKITVDDEGSFTKRYNMTIKTESLREMLHLLSFTTPMKYEIKEDRVFICKP